MRLARLRDAGPLVATVIVALALFALAGVLYDGFFSVRVAAGLISEQAVLGIVAVGMTFVLVSGGIDLSVGAVLGCSSIMIAALVEHAGWHPLAALAVAMAFGAALGGGMGALIHAFELPAFIVTLGGMFLARGLAFVIGQEAISIRHPFYTTLLDLPASCAEACGVNADTAASIGTLIPVTSVVMLAIVGVGVYLAHWTPQGRAVYAVGGDERSARLMGLPVARTKIGVYAFSGLCSALAGGVYTLFTMSGNASAGTMLELDAIAAAVIGGTLLTGGVGTVVGTMVGVLMFSIIQTAIIFDGTLSSWWTRIAVAGLLLGFILLQGALRRALSRRR